MALTFDDGPGPYTARLLDHLAKTRVRATFFVLGELVRPNARLVRRIAAEGHELANHSWSHPDLAGMSSRGVRNEAQRTQAAIQRVSGVRSRLFRPPYGSTNAQVGRAVALPQIMWSVDTLDWSHRNTARTVRIVLKETRGGGIVLFHDVHKPTVAAIPQVISRLSRKGYRFVTVSELFQGKRLRPGVRYYERGP
ncbi:polysaccharide deacetylase family protein [Thermomonospora umbrina]|uniref:polysaccharide deacetylase family protein n=1 Tax=Thermomonospora umbrina TaxID=111806 RepID=UPI001FE2B8C7|nr:polysaccharide deacetylase family protein [Thermomonospora umbrina]